MIKVRAAPTAIIRKRPDMIDLTASRQSAGCGVADERREK
jgi:hypothetical protein